jgi:hypothetical protein
VGVRPDQDAVAEPCGMARASAQHGVLHNDAALAQPHRAILGGQDRAEEDAAVWADLDLAAEHGVRRDVGRRVDARTRAIVLDQHGPSL